jgi:uncharacterized GH25 family protein
MKNILLLFSVLVVLVSCTHPNHAINMRISNSDSVAINYFKGDGTMDTVVAVTIIRDQQIINQLSNFISENKTEMNYACGLDGSLHFFKMNKVIQDINFGMNATGCSYFSFVLNGKYQATNLSVEAKKLIVSVRK